jgi:hypothetical protein
MVAGVNTEAQTDSQRRWVRPAAFVVLLAAAGLLLPLSAYAVEAVSAHAENWIIVVYLAATMLVGGAIGAGVGSLTAPGAPRGRTVAAWTGLGLVAAAVALVVWWLLIAG